VRAIYDVYKNKKDMLILSSVKPHIGHLDAASGIASLIKTVLFLYNKTIPHTLNFEEINPLILPYQKIINILNDPLLLEKDQIVSGVTSLGIGGTNVHVILRSYPGNNPSCLLRHLSASDIFKKTVYVTDTVEDVKLYQENSAKNNVKEVVTEVWKEILGCKDTDIDLNFFDIGGTSFLAIQCLNLLNKRLNKKINLTDFYEYPTLRLFIQKIEAEE
jgi:acyl carrier protein